MFARRLPVLVAEAGVYEIVQFGQNDYELRMWGAPKCRKAAYSNLDEAMEVLELLAAPVAVRHHTGTKAANY